jgi:hypothetical protein
MIGDEDSLEPAGVSQRLSGVGLPLGTGWWPEQESVGDVVEVGLTGK